MARELILTSKELEILDKKLILKEFDNLENDIKSAHKIWIIIVLHFWLKRWNT